MRRGKDRNDGNCGCYCKWCKQNTCCGGIACGGTTVK